eukprot:2092209-Amphidinium_carterae.1
MKRTLSCPSLRAVFEVNVCCKLHALLKHETKLDDTPVRAFSVFARSPLQVCTGNNTVSFFALTNICSCCCQTQLVHDGIVIVFACHQVLESLVLCSDVPMNLNIVFLSALHEGFIPVSGSSGLTKEPVGGAGMLSARAFTRGISAANRKSTRLRTSPKQSCNNLALMLAGGLLDWEAKEPCCSF